jgi:hypothetical protein
MSDRKKQTGERKSPGLPFFEIFNEITKNNVIGSKSTAKLIDDNWDGLALPLYFLAVHGILTQVSAKAMNL